MTPSTRFHSMVWVSRIRWSKLSLSRSKQQHVVVVGPQRLLDRR